MLLADIKPLYVERNRQKHKVEQRCPRTKTVLSENKTPDLPKVAGRTVKVGERDGCLWTGTPWLVRLSCNVFEGFDPITLVFME